MMKENLWNLKVKKTRSVINFIKELDYQSNFEKEHKKRFDQIKEFALSKIQPDEMLKAIGFTNLKFLPNIYEWSIKK